jgi:D-glycero-alpha-D-manno-heptose-7-phosphate kinase
LLVAAIAATARAVGDTLTCDEMLQRAVNLETRVLGVPAGTQDYLAALHGGLGVIRFPADGPTRERLPVDSEALEARIVLVDTGQAHFSGTNNWAITKAYVDGDSDVRRHVRAIAGAARALAAALRCGDLDAAGAAIDDEWTSRRLLAPGVTTPRIEELGRRGREAGALAMKVCGAGGGGCLFLWCRDGARDAVAEAVRAAGAPVLDFRVAPDGVA